MNNQSFSIGISKPSPVISGFVLDFSATEKDQHAAFATGLARINFQRPQFEITGLNFSGLNTLEVNDGQDRVVDQVNFNLKISGYIPDPNLILGESTENNSGALNIERVLVFTGASESALGKLSPQFANFIINTEADPDTLDVNFSLSKEDLNSNTGVIFYRLMPFDRLATGEISNIVSGRLFTGFDDLETFNEEIFISRSNLNDLRFNGQALILASGATGIRIDSQGISSDFGCAFELRTNEEVVITGIDSTVTFVNPPDVTTATTGVTMSGNFQVFTLQKDEVTANNYIIRKAEG